MSPAFAETPAPIAPDKAALPTSPPVATATKEFIPAPKTALPTVVAPFPTVKPNPVPI